MLDKKDDGDSPTWHQSSAALGMIFRTSTEMVEGPGGLGKQQNFDVKQKCVKQRSIFKDGYSVTYAIWKAYLAFYTNLLRLAYGSGKHQRHANWGRHNYQRLLTKWLTSWGIRHQTLHRQQTRPSELLHPSHLHQ